MMTIGEKTIEFDVTITMGEVCKEQQCNTQLVWDSDRRKHEVIQLAGPLSYSQISKYLTSLSVCILISHISPK